MDSQFEGTMKPIAPDWRKRLERGATQLSLEQRTKLLERLIIVHESFDEIMASWEPEIARRIDDYDNGRTEGIPAEVVFAKMREIINRAPKTGKPPVPTTYREIKDQALRLPHGDFYLLLTSLEAALPAEVDPAWRADIQRRIAAIPAEVEQRYRCHNGGWRDDADARDALRAVD